jgi:hypothetical protein
MMAADNKIWIMALFMLVSFVFNALKKKRQKQKDEARENVEESPAPAGFGLQDLISQFEQKYSLETDGVHDANRYEEEIEMDVVDATPEYKMAEDPVNETLRKEPVDQPVKKQKAKTSDDPNFAIQATSTDSEMDLKQMIISNTILNRPEY